MGPSDFFLLPLAAPGTAGPLAKVLEGRRWWRGGGAGGVEVVEVVG